MEPLAATKLVMTWMCMLPAKEPSSMTKKTANNFVVCVIMFAIDLFSVVACSVFIWRFASSDLNATIFAFLGAVTFSSSLYAIPIAFILRHQALSIFNQLSAIYETSK